MHNGRWRYWGPLGIVLGVAFGLRLWGVKQGLPYVYDVDEYGHFVPEAVRMFGHGLNPHYFVNPPALTYVLHAAFGVWFGLLGSSSHASIAREFALGPERFFLLARVVVALLGTVSVWLLYLLGARLFDRAVGLLASAVIAVAFLPVFYGHLALNDAPTLVGLTLSLLGTAGVLRRGRMIDYLLAGVGLGLAAATKYTAGVMLLPLLGAAVAQYRDGAREHRREVAIGTGIALVAALAAYLIANPYSLLDFHAFRAELELQSQYTEQSTASWIGGPKQGSFIYYLWSFTWGLGWIPALAALGGAVSIWRRDRRVGWVLVPVAVLYLLFLGLQGRYFGRWLLPIFPIVCLLAALFAVQSAALLGRLLTRLPIVRGRRSIGLPLRVALAALAVVALCGQGAIYSVHSGLVLSRADTRNLTRDWMVAHVPVGAHIVVEPVVPDPWAQDIGHPTPSTRNGYRWIKYPALVSVIAPDGSLAPEEAKVVNLEDYERTLSPALIPHYEQQGYCWVVSGSTQSGRAYAAPGAVPQAIAYYRALAAQGEVVYHASPYGKGEGPVAFDFDWTFDYYPLAYHRPGPEMTVYRLHGGRCSQPGSG
jgi:4-amino-4-deoxy-L-arabinose transferase-like glycosyltransferase